MSSYLIDMPQKRMSLSGGDRTSVTVWRYTDHAIWVQLCNPSARSSSMTVCRYIPTSAHCGRRRVAVDVAEQGSGRLEAIPVRGSGPLTRLPVLTRNAECAVALMDEGGSALAVGGLPCGLVAGITCSHAYAGALLELGQRRAGHYVDVSRLEVRSGRRPSRGGQHALQHLLRQRPIGESAHRSSAHDRLRHVHDRPTSITC